MLLICEKRKLGLKVILLFVFFNFNFVFLDPLYSSMARTIHVNHI